VKSGKKSHQNSTKPPKCRGLWVNFGGNFKAVATRQAGIAQILLGGLGMENIVQKRFPPVPATLLPSCCSCHVYSLDWVFDLAKAYSYENPAACNFVFIHQFGLG
jgi:hypothetical protein